MSKWKTVKLEDTCALNMGQSPASSSYNKEKKGIPFFQGNADFGPLHPVTRFYCSEPTKIAHANDILLSVRAPIGAVNIAEEDCCIGRGLAGLTPHTDVSLKYLYYVLLGKNDELNFKGTGCTFKAINKKSLGETSFPLPPLKEQKRIADILDKAAELTSLRKQQLEKLDLLVKSKFIDMFGDPVTNPKGWEMTKLSSCIVFLTSGSRGWAKYYSEDGKIFLTISNVKNSMISTKAVQHIRPPNDQEATRTRVQEGDLLLSITADLGRTGVVSKEIAEFGAYINQHLSLIRLDRSKIHPLFASFYLESQAGVIQLQARNQCGVKAGLNFDSIRSVGISLPPLKLQNEFAAFVEKVEEQKAQMQAGLEKMELNYKALMAECFAGESET